MRTLNFYLFFSIFLLLYGLINYYIFLKGWQLIPRGSIARPVYAVLFVLVAASYIGGRLLERYTVCAISDAAIFTGSFWFAVMTYLFIGFIAVDILIGVGRLIPPVYDSIISRRETIRIAVACIVAVSAVITVGLGYINAAKPRVRTLDIAINGKDIPPEGIRLAVASDIHLGVIIGNSRLENMVREINRMSPDAILLVGDILDEDLAPVIEQNLGETLKGLRAKHGVYAVTGNHEYIGGVDEAVKYLEDHGIRMLRDSAVLVNGAFYVVGREDRSVTAFTGKRRKDLHELTAPLDRGKALIVLDHQPFKLGEAEMNRVDLQISGHTHHGQLWPFNYITGAVYELSHGYKRKGNTHIYVSSGFGTWGPPVRVGTVPEILEVVIRPGG
ncbi:MAG: metallophosphoesterase [Spirochaetes bacterium]|nr:metallophosphoesterase [Spirochaetota bacterium]